MCCNNFDLQLSVSSEVLCLCAECNYVTKEPLQSYVSGVSFVLTTDRSRIYAQNICALVCSCYYVY